ncbi:hypothetical protein ROA7450_03410 [Roseovarius albus]|uniref:HEAT repeat domain-containing protein n=1 Tax=Roseovarius albus TaxID=1247867 RepID=A0A1X6ZY56_9RHOB|nr:hypothetical protein [Roseovarius albus]SLN64501.1 hypothetical protein ROA7450_03410 [Roseovarius albus]
MTRLTHIIQSTQKLAYPLALATMLAVGSANACAFHYYVPEQTAVDWLIDGQDVILARPSADNKFAFASARILRGNAPTEQLPYLVDSVLRKKMVRNPDDYVLFARKRDGEWEHVSYVNAAYLSMIEQVQAEAVNWDPGYGADRFAMFAALLNHPDPALKNLALREIDKAPYVMLRQIELSIPVEELARELWSRQGYPFQSVRILLLGLTDADAARDEVYNFINRSKDWDWATNLGAFATALIELDGGNGVNRLENALLSDVAQPLDKLEQVVEALAIHNGTGSPDLRTAIAGALTRMVALRPEAAPMVARQFGNRNDWSQGGALAQVMQNKGVTDPIDQLTIANYVGRAQSSSAKGSLEN